MTVFGPDGRAWSISRRTDPAGLRHALRPGSNWIVEARAGDEVRRWQARSRRSAATLIEHVALALRTGAPSPEGELPAVGASPSGSRGRQAPHRREA